MRNHNEIQSEYWDKSSERIAKINEDDFCLARKEMDAFFDYAGIGTGDSIIEIGCGAGRFTFPLLRRGNSVTGTDVSEKSLRLLADAAKQENFSANLKLWNTDCTSSLGENLFDFAVIGNVIHHFENDQKQNILDNIVKSLKPGGRIAIWEPNALFPFYVPWYAFLELSGIERGIWQAEKGVFFSRRRNLEKILFLAGVDDLKVKHHTFIPLRLGKYVRRIYEFNDFLSRAPFVKNLSAYLWISGRKKI